MLSNVFGNRGPYDNLLINIKSPVNKLFSIEGEFTGEISNKNVRMINTQKKEIEIAFNHSIIVLYFGIIFFNRVNLSP